MNTSSTKKVKAKTHWKSFVNKPQDKKAIWFKDKDGDDYVDDLLPATVFGGICAKTTKVHRTNHTEIAQKYKKITTNNTQQTHPTLNRNKNEFRKKEISEEATESVDSFDYTLRKGMSRKHNHWIAKVGIKPKKAPEDP